MFFVIMKVEGGCMKKTKIIGIILGIVLIIGVIGVTVWMVSKSSKTEDTEKEPEVELPVPKLQIVDEDSNSRPIAVMINNHAQARRNHAGLQDAYVVYEMIVEGGLTRLMAIFKDQDTERIGSVRSSRHNYLDYALEHDAIYVHFGWSPKAESDIKALGINNINGLYDNGFYRDFSLGVDYEHTAFTNMASIRDVANQKGYRMTSNQPLLFQYSIDEIGLEGREDAMIANSISLRYSAYMTSSYLYNPEEKVYYRSVNGEIHKDAVTGEQYHFKNIIVASVNNYNLDSYGRQNLDTVGTGTGYYITNGYAVPITWSKSSRSAQTVYSYMDGTEITVNDGNTFIQIFPTYQTAEIS